MKKEILQELSDIFNIPAIVTTFEKGKFYAVRSDDSSEDTEEKSNAGKFDSFLNVPASEVMEKVSLVLKRADRCFVQEMVEPKYSFVGLISPKKSIVVLNNGSCEGITSGKVSGVSFIEKKGNLKIKGTQKKKMLLSGEIVKDKEALFGKEDYEIIFNLCKHIRDYLGWKSVNVEGVVDSSGKIWIVQARPYGGAK